MNTIKADVKNVKMVAHRGLSGLETENTNAAFVAAGNRSYYGIECDVHITSDGKFAVIHDDSTGRVCAENYVVEETSYDVLKNLRLYDMQLGAKKSGLVRADYVIPELKDYICICKKYSKVAVLELKKTMTEEQVRSVVHCIEEYGYSESTVFISFSWNNLVYVRKHRPDATVQFLTDKHSDGLVEKLANSRFDLDIYFKEVTKELADDLHAHGLKLNCWTVDNPEDAKRMAECGVDFITSNILE